MASDSSLALGPNGLFDKYQVARRDGTHSECAYFVLDVTHDPAARVALLYYARAIQLEQPLFAAQLLNILREHADISA